MRQGFTTSFPWQAFPGVDCRHMVTASEADEMCVWDTFGGAQRKAKKLAQVHPCIQAYRVTNTKVINLYCCGHYEELIVFDPFSLEVLFQLSSYMSPDWITFFNMLRLRN